MSSIKNYDLQIEPSVDIKDDLSHHNLLKFTVRNNDVDFLYRYKYLIAAITFSSFIVYAYSIISVENLLSFNINSLQLKNWLILTGLLLLTGLALSKVRPEDSAIILKDIGVQLISKKSWKFQNTVKVFVPLNDIIDLVVHEGMHGYGQVIFYLCILTKSNDLDKNSLENCIKIIFPEFLPRKDILIKVRKLSRDLLFANSRRYFRRVPGQGLKQIHMH